MSGAGARILPDVLNLIVTKIVNNCSCSLSRFASPPLLHLHLLCGKKLLHLHLLCGKGEG